MFPVAWSHSSVFMCVNNTSFRGLTTTFSATHWFCHFRESETGEGNEVMSVFIMDLRNTPGLTRLALLPQRDSERLQNTVQVIFTILASRELLLCPGWGLCCYYLGFIQLRYYGPKPEWICSHNANIKSCCYIQWFCVVIIPPQLTTLSWMTI